MVVGGAEYGEAPSEISQDKDQNGAGMTQPSSHQCQYQKEIGAIMQGLKDLCKTSDRIYSIVIGTAIGCVGFLIAWGAINEKVNRHEIAINKLFSDVDILDKKCTACENFTGSSVAKDYGMTRVRDYDLSK